MLAAPDSVTWARTEELFVAALDVPSAERGAWLDRHCAGQAGLRRWVDVLLEADQGSLPEHRIGSYRLVREAGRGGMGTVFQAIAPGRQTVAIKIVNDRVPSDAVQRRFRQESRILSHLQHPNIVRLIDDATTSAERPYFVMEYVDGISLTQFLRERAPGISVRVQMFLEICDAVRHVHAIGVIHRDLKPANILVTREGRPTLLDFGIATWIDEPHTTRRERGGFIGSPLTPNYASPEQWHRLQVTTKTDIYALGAILRDTLTPAIPRGALAAIISKAMDRSPHRRYPSIGDMADDVTASARRLRLSDHC
jgi:serine/threonine protein kinase